MGIFDSIKRKFFGFDIKNRNGINEEYIYYSGAEERKNILRKKYNNKDGEYHGKYEEFLKNGNVEVEINYKWGKKYGPTKYFQKGYISAEGNFSNGKPIGLIKQYFSHADTNFAVHPVIKKSADLDRGIYEVFSLNGAILEKSETDGVKFNEGCDIKKGNIYPMRSGLCEKWFENGKLQEKGSWIKITSSVSQRQGEHIEFYENGNVFMKGEWIDDIPIGLHEFFYRSGNIEFIVEYITHKENIYKSEEKGRIIKEKWYDKNGDLMYADEIIKKAGIDQRYIRNSKIHMNYGPIRQYVGFSIINDMKFQRKDRNHRYIGHSYQLLGHYP